VADLTEATQKATRSVKWIFLTEILSRAAGPVVFTVLAVLLQPSEFGLAAIALLLVSFAQIIVEEGAGPGLVLSRLAASPPAANAAFWLNLVLGCVLYGLIVLSAPLAAAFFHEPALTGILRVLGLQIILVSLTSVQRVVLEQSFEFKRLLHSRWISVCGGGVVSIALARQGYGVWALVIGALATAGMNVITVWFVCSWRPSLELDWASIRSIVKFGRWTLLEIYAAWIFVWADQLIVGRYLGVEKLGVFRVASSIAGFFFWTAFTSINAALYPYFMRFNGDPALLTEVFSKLHRLVTAFALPMGIGLALVAPAIAPIVFGDRWIGLGVLLSLAAIRESISWLTGINSEVFRALGRPDINVRAILIGISVCVPAYFVAAPSGVYVLSIVKIVLVAATVLLQVFFTTRLLGVAGTYLWADNRSVAAACAVMCGAVWTSQSLLNVGSTYAMASTAAVVVVGAVVYVAMLAILDRALLSQAIKLLSRVVS